MTLQRRVLAYLALAAIASCALTVGVAIVLVRHRVAAQRMSTLVTETDALANGPGALLVGQHVYRVGGQRAHRTGQLLQRDVLAAIPASGDTQGTAQVDGRAFIYVARATIAGGRVLLIDSAALAFAQWRPFLGSLVLAGLGGALLAVVLSYLLARRLSRPIGQLAVATRRLAAGDERVAVPVAGEDELANLGRAFNEMALDLGRARDEQRRFLESVSHELKTPLTSVRGYAEALEEGAVGPPEAARVIVAEADRLQRLVGDLLDLARLGRAGFSVARERIDLGSIAARAVERHQPQARELSVSLSKAPSNGAWALGDEDRLLQATSNLIENALRLTPPGGSVIVRAGPGEIAVRDTGPGLAADDIPHAFERFYLHDRYRSERPVGSGLGLAIVKELAGAMGGSVQATSARGSGAEFVVRLPTG
jgi:signal transduction histidine kinase